MSWILTNLWLIVALPLSAAGLSALLPRAQKRLSASLAIGSMAGALVLSCLAFFRALESPGRQFLNFKWFQVGADWVQLGWVLDPLTAVMLVMVSFVGLLIFIYSVGYMAHDNNFTRFFCFLALFASAMLGLVVANSLLLLFICWELVGLTSFLLIGFWYKKPSAVAAAKKAFITTRIGDLAFLVGMVWLYSETGTLTFYDKGSGCLEASALAGMLTKGTLMGIAVSTLIGLLVFAGAVGKSGQLPLHVWLPDAMEGPTPVSALIHAATMVAAGVFLVARMYPLMSSTLAAPQFQAEHGARTSLSAPAEPGTHEADKNIRAPMAAEGHSAPPPAFTLKVISWVGVLTAVFAASIAVAQTDIKRILAYSTVSQLGFMMLGLGTGGVAVGMFHLITHAFFKALLFMGAGSVIHGCHEEQDIRHMGGLRKQMPVTFATYAIGMMALSGVPIFFSGFWSKDEILHAAHSWSVSRLPFYLAVLGALLTAFYMTRQVIYVFFGTTRARDKQAKPNESPRSMTVPLMILAGCAIGLGFIGTPAWPWFQSFLSGTRAPVEVGRLFSPGVLGLIAVSTGVVFAGISLGYWFYGRKPLNAATDPLEVARPDIFGVLKARYYVDELYEVTVIRFTLWWAQICELFETRLWQGIVQLVSSVAVGFAWVNRAIDEHVVNPGFDRVCRGLSRAGDEASGWHSGRVQNYLRVIGVALTVLVLLLIWGCRAS